MKQWRRPRSDIRREQAVANALRHSQVDVSGVTLKVVGSTAILKGSVASPQERNAVIHCVLADANIGQVIESVACPGERPTVNIHLGKERQDLRREMDEFCDRRLAGDAWFGAIARAARRMLSWMLPGVPGHK